MQNVGLDESQAIINIEGRNINNLRYADDTTLMAENEEELKNLLMKVKSESEKVGIKSTFKKLRWRYPIPLLHRTDGGKIETVADFFWGAPQSLSMVTAARKLIDACSLEEKPWQTLTFF